MRAVPQEDPSTEGSRAAEHSDTRSDLGPFSPPPDYSFEPELQDPAPRPIPPEARQGLHERRSRLGRRVVFILGITSLVLSMLPFTRNWAKYLLPLRYVFWIGLAFLGLWLVAALSGFFVRGPYRYIREGVPIVARVADLVKAPSVIMNGEPTSYAFTAAIEYQDPDTNEIKRADVKSSDFSASTKDRYRTSFRVGDYVTAIHLPSDASRKVKLYGFLDLRPGFGLIRKEEPAGKEITRGALTVSCIVALFAVLVWNLYAFHRYEPIAVDYSKAALPMVFGGLIIGGAFLALTFVKNRRELRRIAERNTAAIEAGEAREEDAPSFWTAPGFRGWLLRLVVVAGSALLGAATALCLCFSLNAIFDESSPRKQRVQITELLTVTHTFVYRQYVMEYRLPDSEKKHRFCTTPGHLARFKNNLGIADVHAGRLGWPWVKTIHPVLVFDRQHEAALRDSDRR